LGAGIGGLIGLAFAGKGGMEQFKKAYQVANGLPEDIPFDMRDITPQGLRNVAEYFPEVYKAALPPDATLAQDSMPGRDAQLYVMDQLRRRVEQGEPLGERLAAQDVQNRMGQELGRAQEGLVDTLSQRGRLGPGSYLQARAGFGQEAANLARDMGSDLRREQISNRLGALSQLAGVAGQERGQTIGLEEGRANTINRLNEFVANMLTQQNRYGADVRNEAGMYNTGERQRIADYNVQNRQRLMERNQDVQNQNRLYNSRYQLDRAGQIIDTLNMLGSAQDAEAAARMNLAKGIGGGIGGAAGGLLGGGLLG
jgi:hypothetical protein